MSSQNHKYSATFPNKNMQIKMRHDFMSVSLGNIETFVTCYWQECRKMGIHRFCWEHKSVQSIYMAV